MMKFSVQVEWLFRIRACNFIIKTSNCTKDSAVTIKKSSVLIKAPEIGVLEIQFSSVGVALVPDSLSGLSTNGNSVIFRARIESFHSDIQKQRATHSIDYKINEDTVVFCAACKHQVSKTLRITRALPLPSNGEMDFFCHRHSGRKISLEPTKTDLLYDHLYFLIHIDHIEQEGNGAKFICSNCSTALGEIKNSTVKIWNSDVFIRSQACDIDCSIPRASQFMSGLFNLTDDVPTQMNKFVLICDRDLEEVSYTLLWILDRSLMLTECESNRLTIDLNYKIVKKALYSHHTTLTSEVDDFMKSPTSLTISLSPSGEKILLKLLNFMSRNIPIQSSIVNRMKVTYLIFDDIPLDKYESWRYC